MTSRLRCLDTVLPPGAAKPATATPATTATDSVARVPGVATVAVVAVAAAPRPPEKRHPRSRKVRRLAGLPRSKASERLWATPEGPGNCFAAEAGYVLQRLEDPAYRERYECRLYERKTTIGEPPLGGPAGVA